LSASLPGCGEAPAPIELTGGTGATGGATATGGSSGSALSAGKSGAPAGAGTGGSATGGAGSGAGGRNGFGGAATAGGGAAPIAGSAGGPLNTDGGAPPNGGTSGVAGRGGRAAGGTSGDAGGGAMAGSGPTAGAGGAVNPGGFPAKFAGNIDTRGSIRSDFAGYWDQFSPENAGKWGSVQPNSQTQFNWTSLDAMYKYANEHNIIFKQHNFIWGSQQPSWTNNLTSETGPAAVQNWMNAFCERYPNTRLIDVVNEPPPHTTPKYLNAIGGSGSSGWDWIANAFKWARAACPNSILILNDYNNVEQAGDVQHTIDIVNAIKKAGAPIDAVGCQTHGASNMSSSALKSNIDKLASSTGLPVYITEYDLNISDDAKQASVLKDQFTMFWQNENVKGVTYWGYVVGSTWVSNSGLIQSSGTERPAMTWLMEFLGR
jgi:endo-1,4-beta-xylanase